MYIKIYIFKKKRNRITDVENLMVTKGEMEGGINWEIGINTDILLYIKLITNKDQCTAQGTQYFVMAYMVFSHIGKSAYMYIYN